MATPTEIHALIERFERNIDSYRSPAYNEAQLRERVPSFTTDSHGLTRITERSETTLALPATRFAWSFPQSSEPALDLTTGMNPPSFFNFRFPVFRAKNAFPILPFTFVLFTSRQRHSANIASEKTMIQRQIDATDRQIDKQVYDLYGLTPEEIKIVEESTAKRK